MSAIPSFEEVLANAPKQPPSVVTVEFQDGRRFLKYNGAVMQVLSQRIGSGSVFTTLQLLHGDWPTDDELITMCDDGDMIVRHYGGHVRTLRNVATVEVYVD